MIHTYRIGHLFAGIGGGALGAQAASARVGDHEALFETVGGVDFDELACQDFERLVGAPAVRADLHTMAPAELLRAWGPRAPHVVVLSPPCKGYSGLLSAKRAEEPKYQAMNRLFLDGLFLLCSTWPDPPPIIFVENVPRIATRGRALLEQARQLLISHGYAVHEGNHDCGEIGSLAQHRRRFFLVARHRARVPHFLYQPHRRRVRACGEVLGQLPMPGDVEAAGPMHSIPRLSWRNWVRLALIPAGGDWRDLPGVVPQGKKRRDVHRRQAVADWAEPVDAVVGPGGAAADNVADPRIQLALGASDGRHWNKYAVGAWGEPARTVIGAVQPGSGGPAVADPRPAWQHVAGVTPWTKPAPTITAGAKIHAGAFQVADPRVAEWYRGILGVTDWGAPAATVTGHARGSTGAFSVADPRLHCAPRAGAYRVLRWDEAAATITGSLAVDNGAAAVADPRLNPDRPPPFTPIILAADGTWHRPLTTLELAVLQSLPPVIDGKPLVLAGSSHTRWREAIGNMIPPASMESVAEQLLRCLLLAELGAFELSSGELWVAPEAA